MAIIILTLIHIGLVLICRQMLINKNRKIGWPLDFTDLVMSIMPVVNIIFIVSLFDSKCFTDKLVDMFFSRW